MDNCPGAPASSLSPVKGVRDGDPLACPSRPFPWELSAITLLLVVLNWPLLYGTCNQALVFLPAPVRNGEWWRVLAHPFVHVTWYHLLLDGSAFLLLYKDLRQQHW